MTMLNPNNKPVNSLKITILLLLLMLIFPLIATYLSPEVNWGLEDFIVAGCLLMAISFAYWLLARRTKHLNFRVGIAVMLFAYLLSIWVNMAVGIIGEPENPVNLLFYVLLAGGALPLVWGKLSLESMKTTNTFLAISFVITSAAVLYLGYSAAAAVFTVAIAAAFAVSAVLITQTEKKIVNH